VTLTVALIRDVFFDRPERLLEQLLDARRRGAQVAVLPELPLNPWSPASKRASETDAEPVNGPRFTTMSDAARRAGIGLVGGAIQSHPESGRRHNTALVFDAAGGLVSSYRKVHLPQEDGFWEAHHYEPGDALAPVVDAFPLRLGVQICSDINRPQGAHLLAASGAEVIVNQRATEAATFERWKTVFIATAMTSGTYVLSVPRPGEEHGVKLGGPSFAVAPTGEVLLETIEPMATVTLERSLVVKARRQYPGYLAVRSDLYSEGWRELKTTRLPHEND
jgi:N-carbamoylputrescine amidase